MYRSVNETLSQILTHIIISVTIIWSPLSILKKKNQRLLWISRSSVPAWYQCINRWIDFFFELTFLLTKVIGKFWFLAVSWRLVYTSGIGVLGVSMKPMQSLFAVSIFEASTECGRAVPICGHVLISDKIWSSKARMIFPLYIISTLQSLLKFDVGDLLELSKKSSCLYRASAVLRHYFITPNWCTQL